MADRTCAQCGDNISHKNRQARYCGKRCRDAARPNGGHRVISSADCDWCGKTFDLTADNPRARGCSVSCGIRLTKSTGATCEVRWLQCNWCDAWRTSRTSHDCEEQHKPVPRPSVNCQVCKTEMEDAHGHKRYCSPLCKHIAATGPDRSIWIVDCAWCDTTYVSRFEHGAYCSKRCSRQARRGPGRFVVPDPVRHAIYKRDRWRCQLCGKQVGKKYPPQHDRAPSLDHILPQSLGGSDEPSNLQLVHRICNSRKRDTAWQGGEQLTLSAAG